MHQTIAQKQLSLFDILGPVMIGPSSSHPAGVARIGYLARKLFGAQPDSVRVPFYGSLGTTWKGHGSGDAIVAGLMGIPPEDERLRDGQQLLAKALAGGTGFPITKEINGYIVALSGMLDALLVVHRDKSGVIAIVSHILAANHINIAATSSHRKEKGDEADRGQYAYFDKRKCRRRPRSHTDGTALQKTHSGR